MAGEFEFIQNLKDRYGLGRVGDDCAVLPKDELTDQLITADLLVEDVDFRLDWIAPAMLGHKALAVSLSDIAAMGGSPKWSVISVGVPKDVWESGFLDSFYEGLFRLAQRFGVEVVGGDISRTPDRLVVDSVVGGETPKGSAVLRSGARPGDLVVVTGTLGGAAGGLELLRSGIDLDRTDAAGKELMRRQLTPVPRTEAGEALGRAGLASAMIDISDGLAADLYHICDASGVGAVIDAEGIPVDPNLDALGVSIDERLRLATSGGEDFELLLTVPKKKISSLPNGDFSLIGEITANAGVAELRGTRGTTVLPRSGYRHF